MAIVVQSDRFLPENQRGADKIGPGQYEPYQQFKNDKKNNVHFNSSVEKEVKNKKTRKQDNPGPGAYEVVQNPFSEKILVSINDEKGQKIIEIPKQNTVFKSKLERFRHKSEHKQIPGPGHYFQPKQEKNQKEFQKTQTIIQALKEHNEYQHVPSIPGVGYSYGYTENEENKLILNVPQIDIHTGVKEDKVGPGHYPYIDQFTKNKIYDKGTGWSQKKDKKLKPIYNSTTQQSVGPGKYEAKQEQQSLYQQNLSHGFASTTHRFWDQRKGMIANKAIIEKAKLQSKIQTGQDVFDESQFEYIDDNTPGPGYYHNDSTQSSIKQKKNDKISSFGQKSTKFKENLSRTVGPGDYKVVQLKDKISHINSNAPFHTMTKRFQNSVQENKPGPGTYDPKTNISDNVKLNNCGTFNSKQEKIKKIEVDDQPGPGQYINPDIIAFQNYQDVIAGKQSYVFQSQLNRQIFKKNEYQQPDCTSYDIKNFTIQKKTELDENFVQKPAFLTKQKRIECGYQKEKKEELPLYKTQTLNEYFVSNQKQNVPFNSKRFRAQEEEQKNKNKLGPGQYNNATQKDWKKKTFNILFAEI